MKSKQNLFGILFSVGATILFGLGAIQLYQSWMGEHGHFISKQVSERKAFLNMQRIANAQGQYFNTDWDSDGKQTYANFFVHLWTSIDRDNNPIHLGLIPKALAFAMDRARAIDGYFYIYLQDRIVPLSGELKPLDSQKEWAVMAIPLTDGRTSMLHFMADHSGKIFAKSARFASEQYIDDPISQGWTVVESVEELQTFTSNAEN